MLTDEVLNLLYELFRTKEGYAIYGHNEDEAVLWRQAKELTTCACAGDTDHLKEVWDQLMDMIVRDGLDLETMNQLLESREESSV